MSVVSYLVLDGNHVRQPTIMLDLEGERKKVEREWEWGHVLSGERECVGM